MSPSCIAPVDALLPSPLEPAATSSRLADLPSFARALARSIHRRVVLSPPPRPEAVGSTQPSPPTKLKLASGAP
eukprot:650149-Rhodomonas_salina.1